jgi:uncharacterized RDD family membrane protein YckC
MQNIPPPPPPGFLPPPPPPPSGIPPPKPPPGGYAVEAFRPVWAEHQEAFAPRYGGFWIRLAAAIFDSIIVTVALFIVFFAIGLVAGIAGLATGLRPSATGSSVETVANLIYVVLYVGYFIYFWGMGQTPAMRRLGLQVVDATTGAPIGFGRAALRYVGYLLSALACDVGLIWAAFDPRKQGWHDKIARTVVIRVEN